MNSCFASAMAQAKTIGMIRMLPLELSTRNFVRAMQEGSSGVPNFKGGKM